MDPFISIKKAFYWLAGVLEAYSTFIGGKWPFCAVTANIPGASKHAFLFLIVLLLTYKNVHIHRAT
jgi:hypothetical protein